MATFDADAARAAGHSEADIARIQQGIAAARAAGYSDDEIMQHLGGQGAPTPAAPPTSSPAPAAAAAPAPEWSTSRVLKDLGHYPAMALQAVTNGGVGLLNFPGEASDVINRYTAPYLPKVLTTPVKDLPAYLSGKSTRSLSDLVTGNNQSGIDLGEFPKVPSVDFGAIAQPQNAAEAYGASALAGGAAALTGGAISRGPALLHATGKELMSEVPRLLKESGVLGAIPGVATEAANQNLDLSALDPGVRTAVEATIGATAAIAAHRFMGGNPVEGVAAKLGDSADADEAGHVAQTKVREWRGALGAKLDALKGQAFVQTGDDTYGPTMFGKVPLKDATTDNIETMRTLGELTSQGGVYKDVFHTFVSDMPPRMKAMFESIAQRNSPITEYAPQREVPPEGVKSAGPVSEVPPQMTGGPIPRYGPDGNPMPRGPDAPYRGPWNADTERYGPLQTVSSGPREVGFPVGEPPASPQFASPRSTVVGFKAPLQDTMDFRSAVGEWISNPKLMPKGVNEAQASALYKSLTQDIGNTMERYGAGDDWAQYNAKASALYHAGNLLSKIAGDVNPSKDPKAGGIAVSSLWGNWRKDSSEIANLREQVPEAANEVSAAYLRKHPEKWNTLPDATQRAMVPNPFDRLVLNSSAAKAPSPLINLQHLAEMPTAASAGYVLGKAAESYAHDASLGATAPPYALTAAAMALPPAARFVGKVWHNPRLLNVPITGGIAGVAGGEAGISPLLAKPLTTP